MGLSHTYRYYKCVLKSCNNNTHDTTYYISGIIYIYTHISSYSFSTHKSFSSSLCFSTQLLLLYFDSVQYKSACMLRYLYRVNNIWPNLLHHRIYIYLWPACSGRECCYNLVSWVDLENPGLCLNWLHDWVTRVFKLWPYIQASMIVVIMLQPLICMYMTSFPRA